MTGLATSYDGEDDEENNEEDGLGSPHLWLLEGVGRRRGLHGLR